MTDERGTSGWKRFWDRGGWWKAVILVIVYFAVYQAMAFFIVGPLFSGIWGKSGSASYIFFTTALPILLACIVLVLFGLSIGWLKELFGPQPIRGRGWMWIAVAVVLVFNVIHLFSIDYAKAGFEVVATWLLAGLFIGFAEETLTRGYVVNLMRRAGHREISVAAVSAAVFAALHAGNLLEGQSPIATLIQLVYTFAFGVLMYLSMRVTGTLWAPILLHASTDPTIFLATGYPVEGAVSTVGGFGNYAVIAAGLVMLFFIRGKVPEGTYSTGVVDGVRPSTPA